MEAVVSATTVLNWDTGLPMEDVAFVAQADGRTGVTAQQGSPWVRAGGWAGISAGFVVAVLRAGLGCLGGGEEQVSIYMNCIQFQWRHYISGSKPRILTCSWTKTPISLRH